jgi:hypothetical protein
MIGIDQELSVAQSAKAAIDALSTLGPNASIVETLRHARDVAASAMTFLGDGPLNDERDKIGITFSILIRALGDSGLTREKIENAKSLERPARCVGIDSVSRRNGRNENGPSH